MMPRVTCLLVLLVIPACSKPDSKQVVGSWTVEEAIVGSPTPVIASMTMKIDSPNPTKVVFTADKLQFTDPDGVKTETAYLLDPAAMPRAIDLDKVDAVPMLMNVDVAGKRFGKSAKPLDSGLKGIYQLDGDTLKVCLAAPSFDRPKVFAVNNPVGQASGAIKDGKLMIDNTPGAGHLLMTLKRSK